MVSFLLTVFFEICVRFVFDFCINNKWPRVKRRILVQDQLVFHLFALDERFRNGRFLVNISEADDRFSFS